MTTEYTYRITIACPEALIQDARNLAAILGYGPQDADTFTTAAYQDANGNRYACASTLVFGTFVQKATNPLERPEWDVEPYKVNMAGAARAQARVRLVDPSVSTDGAQADPGSVVAVVGDDAMAALAMMGLTPVPSEEDAPV